ncbi:hypothetical protein D3C76_100270 [compost metagenome]
MLTKPLFREFGTGSGYGLKSSKKRRAKKKASSTTKIIDLSQVKRLGKKSNGIKKRRKRRIASQRSSWLRRKRSLRTRRRRAMRHPARDYQVKIPVTPPFVPAANQTAPKPAPDPLVIPNRPVPALQMVPVELHTPSAAPAQEAVQQEPDKAAALEAATVTPNSPAEPWLNEAVIHATSVEVDTSHQDAPVEAISTEMIEPPSVVSWEDVTSSEFVPDPAFIQVLSVGGKTSIPTTDLSPVEMDESVGTIVNAEAISLISQQIRTDPSE